ncbi:MAG: toxin-antitoxin system YwqK family antitoxin [Lewinella sp.]|jgi:antitoxin component YwqK of YwqJK toxin-antitoxin module|uniref:toxin-antitoxin system YwqK family antitoxin n=1 Tax=Lewinella sp. TaxID=2004506 RepID=UPI003D6A913F
MKTFFSLVLVLAMLFSCENNTSPEPVTASPAGTEASSSASDYEITPVSGTSANMATLYSPEGKIMEAGPMVNGKKNGSWAYYGAKGSFPVKVISFVEDMYTGVYMEFNERGQAELMATYKNNKLHGPWGKYRFGREELTANYKDGELDGVLREYDYRDGKLKKEASYKAGQLDGLVRDYDPEGNVMVEYMYRDGEKISGGMVE